MKLLDKSLNPIQYTEMYWLGNFFGDPAKHSIFNQVFLNYLPDTTAALLIDGGTINGYDGIVIEDRCNHPIDNYHPNDYVTLTSGFNFKEFPRTFKKSDIFYFPFWLFFSRIAQMTDVEPFPDSRAYYASCVNRNPRMQRIYNVMQLTKRTYFNDMYITFRNDLLPAMTHQIVDTLGQDFYNEFSTIYGSLPVSHFDMMNELYHCSRVYEAGWTDSYLNVATTASIDNDGFLCEKVFKPFRAEQLFLFQAPPNTVSYLRSIGFDMMDDYINHTHYDSELDWKRRTDLMLEVLDEIYHDIPKIFLATKSRRVYNRELLQSKGLENSLLKDIINCIEQKGKLL